MSITFLFFSPKLKRLAQKNIYIILFNPKIRKENGFLSLKKGNIPKKSI